MDIASTNTAATTNTLTAPAYMPARDSYRIALGNVTNPTASGTLTIHSSSDTLSSGTSTPIPAPASAGSITGVSAVQSTTVSAAQHVNWTVGFTTRSTGALIASRGALTLAATGTSFPAFTNF